MTRRTIANFNAREQRRREAAADRLQQYERQGFFELGNELWNTWTPYRRQYQRVTPLRGPRGRTQALKWRNEKVTTC